MSNDDIFVQALRDMLATDRVLYSNIRYLDGATRNAILTTHLRNNNNMMAMLRYLATQEPESLLPRIPAPPPPLNTTAHTFTIPLTPNLLSSFLNPVPIVPSPAQIEAGTTNVFAPAGTSCAICQDNVNGSACEIRHCHHMFHRECIGQWFRESPRCPVCRHDIRSLQRSRTETLDASDSGNADEE